MGIVVQHGTDDVEIDNNEIPDRIAADDTDSDPSDGVDFGFAFAQGINTASPATTDTTTNHDVIEGITSAEPILPEPVKIDGDGDGLQSRANQFRVAIGINDRNDTDDGSRDPADDPEIDVKNDYWNSSGRPQEAVFNQDAGDDDRADVVGNIAYQPFLRNQPGKNEEDGGNGSGNDDVGGKGNGNGN